MGTRREIQPGPPMAVEKAVSVRDHGAFIARHLPDLGHDVKDFKVYTWTITNWKQLDKKLTSPDFQCGGHTWHILLFPSGNQAPPSDSVSLYLDSVDAKEKPEGWHACVQFACVISNISDPTIHAVSHAHHRFTTEEPDWGFTRFRESRTLFSPTEGQARPVIENESAEITVFVRVVADPTGVLWHNFVNYNSKKVTGCVGLKNQGATGYMNSVLQPLYFLHSFPKAIYQIPTANDQPTDSTALALQRIFYCLQCSNEAVVTTELTKSFGWKALDSFLQRDVQEFNRVLQDRLISTTKGTGVEGAIEKLFVGKMRSYIKCLHVNYSLAHTQDFYDLQLHVKGMKDLRESFQDYIQVDLLNGQRQFHTERFGLQDANKGIIFESFPPVLTLQLKRFEYDIQQDAIVKVNDRHVYPPEIDLQEFLDWSADRWRPWVYKLFSVIVHSGDISGGKYYCFVNPDLKGRWLKFNDERVTPATEHDVFTANYGGGNTGEPFTNAYMLFYVRESSSHEVLAPLNGGDIPRHVRNGLDDEVQLEARRRAREEAHLFISIKIITDETFSHHEGFDLASFDEPHWPSSELPTFSVLKSEPYTTFKGRVAQHFNSAEGQFRLWTLVGRQNRTWRPRMCIRDDEPSTMEFIRSAMGSAYVLQLRLYLEATPSKPDPLSRSIMIFMKHFDASTQSLLGVGKVNVQLNSRLHELVPVINQRMGWAPETSLELYEEIKPGMIEKLVLDATFTKSELQDGDIICFQVVLPRREIQDLEKRLLWTTPVQFYSYIQDRIMVTFRAKYQEQDPDHSKFELVLSVKYDYNMMAARVGKHLGHDPSRLRFTRERFGRQGSVLNASLNQNVAKFLTSGTVVLYEKLSSERGVDPGPVETKKVTGERMPMSQGAVGEKVPIIRGDAEQAASISESNAEARSPIIRG